MNRVAVIGSPGTGKSTFAQQLCKRTGLPLIHLDRYYHNQQHNYYTDRKAWRTKANQFTLGDTWIIDGNYSSTMATRLERADTIFYFDMPTHIALKGLIKRCLTANEPQERPDIPQGWQDTPTLAFFWKVLWFRHNYARQTRELLTRHKGKKIIIFKNHRQVDAYLRHPTSPDSLSEFVSVHNLHNNKNPSN